MRVWLQTQGLRVNPRLTFGRGARRGEYIRRVWLQTECGHLRQGVQAW